MLKMPNTTSGTLCQSLAVLFVVTVLFVGGYVAALVSMPYAPSQKPKCLFLGNHAILATVHGVYVIGDCVRVNSGHVYFDPPDGTASYPVVVEEQERKGVPK